MRWAVAFVTVTACGRSGFDPRSDATLVAPSDVRSTLSVMQPPGETLADFPLLVVLDDTRAARDLMDPNGNDLRFYDDAGNVLAHQIEQIGAPGGAPLIAWVRVPFVTAGTELLVDYGHSPRATSTQSAWSPPYVGVWHMADLSDATANNHSGTWLSASNPTAMPAQVGSGLKFAAATSDAMQIADATELGFSMALTASGWMNLTTFATTSGYSALVSREQIANKDDLWLGVRDNAATSAVYTTTLVEIDTPATVSANTWFQLALTFDGSTQRVYLNGAEVGQFSIAGVIAHTQHGVLIGADRNNGAAPDSDFVTGTLDEIRLENVTRSAAWLAFDSLSQRDAVLQYGPVSR